MKTIFIDGASGTTGLKIEKRLSERNDLKLMILPDNIRKDEKARFDAINTADISFLCLPDREAIRAVWMVENENSVIIDTSTAHRTEPGWTYGFPEILGREKIRNAKRIGNPGCHASGFIALIAPLIENHVMKKTQALSCFSITGYSGGGKKMIARYESDKPSGLLEAPRLYGLTQCHKHLKEMKTICSLDREPVFSPIVAPFYSGMSVTVPLFREDINIGIKELKELYREKYSGKIVFFKENSDEEGFLSANAYAGKDSMEISLFGNEERIILNARYDNLGKGASGAAIQNMNIVLGVEEDLGLYL